MKLLTILFLVASMFSTEAATYYIDFDGGSDSNNGTSTSTPWKRAPGMKNRTGSYGHSPGDRFIFKGGVTWPVNSFQWKFVGGGSSEANRTYVGVDTNWYTGGAWQPPIFDFQETPVGPGWDLAAYLLLENISYVTIDRLHFKNARFHLQDNTAGVSQFGASIINAKASHFVTVTNCWFINTSQIPAANGTIPLGGQGGTCVLARDGSTQTRVLRPWAHNQGITLNGGGAFAHQVYEVSDGLFHDTCMTPQLNGTVFRRNYVHHMRNPADPQAHNNVALMPGWAFFEDNLIHDIPVIAQVLYGSPQAYGAATAVFYNNVIFKITQPALVLGNERVQGTVNGNTEARAINNTIAPNQNVWAVRIGARAEPKLGTIIVRNNHLIGDWTMIETGAGATNLTISDNLIQTIATANAAGYTQANRYQPISGSATTVDTGIDFSSFFTKDHYGNTRTVPWDKGAYEWQGTVSNPGVLSVATDTYNTAENTTLQVSFIRTGGSAGTVGLSYATANGTAIAGTDYTTASGTVSFVDGDVVETVNITILRNASHTGNRSFTITASSPTGGATLTAPTTATITITDSDPPVAEIPKLEYSFKATNMLMATPFSADANGVVSQPNQTATNQSGTLMARFVMTNAATYKLWLTNNAPSQASDSFFIRVNGTNDTHDIIPLTSGLERRLVNWRGSGSFDAPQFWPMQWSFAAGSTNLLVIYGREGGVGVQGGLWEEVSVTQQTFAFNQSRYDTVEGDTAIITVIRGGGTNGAVSVNYATSDGVNGTAGVDYTATSGTLNFAEGETSKTFEVSIIDDFVYTSPSKAFNVTLSSPSSGTALAVPSTAIVSIAENDPPPFTRTIRVRKLIIGPAQ